MEVIIYDWPPSVGATLWVEEKIWWLARPDVEIVTNFVKLKMLLDLEFPNKEVHAHFRASFLELIEAARKHQRRKIIFDGSPITLNALEHMKTGMVSSKSRKAAIRCMEEIGTKVSIVLLKPQIRFAWAGNMRYFNEQNVVPYWCSLEFAYTDIWQTPTIVEVWASPYRTRF